MQSAMIELGRRAKAASRLVSKSGVETRDAALLGGADLLEARAKEILEANARDVARAEQSGATGAQVDRVRLTLSRIGSMASGLRQVAALPDPLGEVVAGWVRPNGLRVEQVRVPLGVVGIIYENRPNVTSDAAGLCLKAGNATLLRGSSAALESNRAIVGLLGEALAKAGLPEDALILVQDTSHEAAIEFMQLDGLIDCLIPRGGHSLIESVRQHATVPTVIDGDGNCHVYVDESADLDMALSIVLNSKTQRPSVCNAAESLVLHASIAKRFLAMADEPLGAVELRGDERVQGLLARVVPATDADFGREYLDLVMSVAVVDDLDAAIDHVNRYSTGHSEAIVTRDLAAAERFCAEVDAAAVLVNASTRFIDGGELGLGAEIGISTQKLHARGPMGLAALTCVKYVVRGNGQVRV